MSGRKCLMLIAVTLTLLIVACTVGQEPVIVGDYGLMEEPQGYIVVSDSLSGNSHIIATREPAEWFSVAAWLPRDWLVLQSYYAGPDGWPAVWTVQADGNGLLKLTDGTFLAKFDD